MSSQTREVNKTSLIRVEILNLRIEVLLVFLIRPPYFKQFFAIHTTCMATIAWQFRQEIHAQNIYISERNKRRRVITFTSLCKC